MSEQNNCGLQPMPSAGRLRWLRERRRTRRAVQGLRAALLAGFSKILAEKLLRLWEADPAAVLAAEQPHNFTDTQ